MLKILVAVDGSDCSLRAVDYLIDKLHAAASRALQQTAVKARFFTLQLESFKDNTPEANAKRLAAEGRFFADVAEKMGFKPQ